LEGGSKDCAAFGAICKCDVPAGAIRG